MPQPNLEGCWLWPAPSRRPDLRPIVSRRYVYRMVYEAATGELLDRHTVLHHLCGNAWCVNPLHVEALSQSQHVKTHGYGGDWGQAKKTHCKNGHPYDEDNTYVYIRKNGSVERHCQTCVRAAKKKYRAKT